MTLGFEIEKTPVPTDEDISRNRFDGILEGLNTVDEHSTAHYLPLATKLLEEQGVNVLAKALCAMAGHQSHSYSLLNGTEGYTTLRVTSRKEPVSKVDAVSLLHRLGGKNFGLAQICPDGSTVIDCETAQLPTIFEACKKQREGSMQVSVVRELPEVTPTDQILSFRQGALAMDEKYSHIMNPTDDIIRPTEDLIIHKE